MEVDQLRVVDPLEFIDYLYDERRRAPVFVTSTDGVSPSEMARLERVTVVDQPFDAKVLALRIRAAIDDAALK